MKFNWGHGIFLFFLCFATFIVFMVLKMSREKYDLVSDDYYTKEIAFQSNIDAAHNSITYNEHASISVNTDGNIVAMLSTGNNTDAIATQLTFYKPDDKAADFTTTISLSAQPVILSMQGKPHGRWHVYATWENKGHKAASTFDIER